MKGVGRGASYRSAIRRVVLSPWLQLVVGLIMFGSSIAGQQGTLYSDLISFRIRVHHGVNLMGLWQILQALPNLWDSVTWIFSRSLDKESSS